MKVLVSKSKEAKVYVLHENNDWILPLREAFEELNTPFEEWFLDEGKISLEKSPPKGIFFNRMSASSHTRNHRYSVEYTAAVIAWLEASGRKVINGNRAIHLEVRKFDQYLGLKQFGLRTPKTIIATGKKQIANAVNELGLFPFILKPNRGGKGLGVQLFQSLEQLQKYIDSVNIEDISLDGIVHVQEYIKPVNNRIIRLEFVNYQYVYALSVDTSGGFELCPADSCQIGNLACPVEGADIEEKFKILSDFQIPEIPLCEAFLRANDIAIAGIEFVTDAEGQRYFYDVNTNTNYNAGAEKNAEIHTGGMRRIAQYLNTELQHTKHDENVKVKHVAIKNSAKLISMGM